MAGELITSIVASVIGAILSIFILHFAAKIVIKKKAKLMIAVTICAIQLVVSLVFDILSALTLGLFTYIGALIALILYVWLIKHFYNLKWGKAIIIALVVWVIAVVIGFVLAMLLALAIFGAVWGAA